MKTGQKRKVDEDSEIVAYIESLKEILARDGRVSFFVVVKTGSSSNMFYGIDRFIDGNGKETVYLRTRAKGQREKDRANYNVREFLASIFGVPSSCVEIISGRSASKKLIQIKLIQHT